jgi:hypothetical protein
VIGAVALVLLVAAAVLVFRKRPSNGVSSSKESSTDPAAWDNNSKHGMYMNPMVNTSVPGDRA